MPLTPQKSLPLKLLKVGFVFILFSISGLMFRSNDASSMVLLLKGIFLNARDFISQDLMVGNELWLGNVGTLVGGSEFFWMERISNLEKVTYMFGVMVLFHWFQYSPEKLQIFRKYDSWLMPLLGVLTILMLAMLSQDDE